MDRGHRILMMSLSRNNKSKCATSATNPTPLFTEASPQASPDTRTPPDFQPAASSSPKERSIPTSGKAEHRPACCDKDSDHWNSGSELDDSRYDEDYDVEKDSDSGESDSASAGESDAEAATKQETEEKNRSRKRVRDPLTKTGRKRIRNEQSWQCTIRRKNRQHGQQYKARSGKIIQAKNPKPVNCIKCRFKCTEKMSEEKRIQCSQYYYSIDGSQKKDFLCRQVKVSSVERRRGCKGHRKPKSLSCSYYLPLADSEADVRVCQNFFCKTLSLSKKSVMYVIQNRNDLGQFVSPNLQKGKTPACKTSDAREQQVREHIMSFPVVESHYCRADTTAKYLSADLNIAQMYRLYRSTFCTEKHIEDPVSAGVYRRIFVTDFNIRFFMPKKDQCCVCNAYYSAKDDEKEKLKGQWEDHKTREKESMDMKKADKIAATNDQTIHAITFDLQAVLPLPFAGDAQIYYSRKLAVYNFTIYDTASNNGYCYMWDETEGKRGANEVATCLLDYLKHLPEAIRTVTSFSDTCAGQNRNQFICASMIYAVQETSITRIDLKYMESGHSYLEADSMHSTIESAKRHQKIYTTREYELVAAGARKKPRPYTVKRLTHKNFLDFKHLCAQVINNRTRNTDGENVQWLKIKWLRFEKSNPFVIEYKTNLSSETFMKLDVRGQNAEVAGLDLQRAYNSKLPISAAKKKDLMNLVKSHVIPADYSAWYSNLPVSKTARDCLPEPGADEAEDETDN